MFTGLAENRLVYSSLELNESNEKNKVQRGMEVPNLQAFISRIYGFCMGGSTINGWQQKQLQHVSIS